ncbi:hypothetical protein AV530_011309 [Patagioenas fasciata monilis]|uniref:Uncharacterized protein n=1 Tax=Patagioenas fasciata monilis TaxID=372326 RepID=A0A1V4KNX4_PATFA|nr:hypothetical protein AV530_011309 [Patagioenas fasciata monilis]
MCCRFMTSAGSPEHVCRQGASRPTYKLLFRPLLFEFDVLVQCVTSRSWILVLTSSIPRGLLCRDKPAREFVCAEFYHRAHPESRLVSVSARLQYKRKTKWGLHLSKLLIT